MNHSFYLAIRQRLIDAGKEARRAIRFGEERKEAKQPNLSIVLVEEKGNEEAILRSVTEFQPAGALKLPIPYRINCAYTFANGKFLHLKSWLLGSLVSGAHIVALTQARDVTWHPGAQKGYLVCVL